MKEELYIFKGNERYSLDINSPSGITFNFNSSLFNDLSHISNSYTYTFSIPKTNHNRKVLDMMEDLRNSQDSHSKKFNCEYYLDGVSMCENAYLYINSIEPNHYNGVIVWNISKALHIISEHDISLTELDDYNTYQERESDNASRTNKKRDFDGSNPRTLVVYGRATTSFDENLDVLCPVYGTGLPLIDQNESVIQTKLIGKSYITAFDSESTDVVVQRMCPLPSPSIRIHKLLDKINSYFGVNISLASKGALSMLDTRDNDVMKYGIIPCVKTESSEYLNDAMTVRFVGMSHSYTVEDHILLSNYSAPKYKDNDAITPVYFSSSYKESEDALYINGGEGWLEPEDVGKCVGVRVREGVSLEIDGYVRIRCHKRYTGDDVPKLIVKRCVMSYKLRDNPGEGRIVASLKDTENNEIVSIDGVFDYDFSNNEASGYYYDFHFDKDFGYDRLNTGTILQGSDGSDYIKNHSSFVRYYVYCLCLSKDMSEYDESGIALVSISNTIKFIPKFDNGVCYGSMPFETVGALRFVDLYPNLPDISCLDFVKSLFFINGGYPKLKSDGSIGLSSYLDIKNNIGSIVYDWSDKLNDSVLDEPKINMYVTDFARHNYYLMKNENEKDEEDEDTTEDKYGDLYEKTKVDIHIDDVLLKKSRVVYQAPYYDFYSRQGKAHFYNTGKGIKLWSLDGNLMSAEEANPALLVLNKQLISTPTNAQVQWSKWYLSSYVWRFADSESLEYLASIVKDGYEIEVDVRLSVFDLRDLDYTKPVYLERFNSYFAIEKIEYKDGKSVATLLKLPPLEKLVYVPSTSEDDYVVVVTDKNNNEYQSTQGAQFSSSFKKSFVVNVYYKGNVCSFSTVIYKLTVDGSVLINTQTPNPSINIDVEIPETSHNATIEFDVRNAGGYTGSLKKTISFTLTKVEESGSGDTDVESGDIVDNDYHVIVNDGTDEITSDIVNIDYSDQETIAFNKSLSVSIKKGSTQASVGSLVKTIYVDGVIDETSSFVSPLVVNKELSKANHNITITIDAFGLNSSSERISRTIKFNLLAQ